MNFLDGQMLLVSGSVVMIAAVLGGIVSAIVLHMNGKQLEECFNQEYGQKKH